MNTKPIFIYILNFKLPALRPSKFFLRATGVSLTHKKEETSTLEDSSAIEDLRFASLLIAGATNTATIKRSVLNISLVFYLKYR